MPLCTQMKGDVPIDIIFLVSEQALLPVELSSCVRYGDRCERGKVHLACRYGQMGFLVDEGSHEQILKEAIVTFEA